MLPVEAVHHFELSPQVLLGEVVEHAGVHQGLHEVGAVLRQTQTGKPLIPNPLVVHVSIRQRLRSQKRRLNTYLREWTQTVETTTQYVFLYLVQELETFVLSLIVNFLTKFSVR